MVFGMRMGEKEMNEILEWPLFFKDNLKLGNINSPIGVCTLWTKQDIIYSKLSESDYAICGNLYTAQGINPLIKNVLANPMIRTIVLCGNDLMKSGDALVNFFKSGVDGSRKIVNSSGFIDSNVDSSLIELIRKNVNIVDMRGKEGEIPKKVAELKSTPTKPFGKPVLIKELESSSSNLSSEEVAFKVVGKTIADAWLKILDVVMKFGEEKGSEHKIRQKEVLDLVAVVEGEDEKIAPWLNFTEKDLQSYYKTFFGSGAEKGVEYTYGERLFKYALDDMPEKFLGEMRETTDQIKSIVGKLKESPYTRRAVAFTLRRADAGSQNPPCLTQITWNIKNKKLYQTAVFRSNDMFGAWPLNAFALRKLQTTIAGELGLEAGSLITIANSAHIYENSWMAAKSVLDKYYTGKTVKFEEDKNGYFIVSVDKKAGDIVVQHHLNDGRKSEFTFRGKKPQELYRRILNEHLITKLDHAAYIGQELARAEIALKEGKKFVQDEA